MFSGDGKLNVGPKKKNKGYSSLCYWNGNSISAYDHSKLFLLNSHNSLYKFDIICLSETYLDSNIPLHGENLELSVYTLFKNLTPNAEVSVSPTKMVWL